MSAQRHAFQPRRRQDRSGRRRLQTLVGPPYRSQDTLIFKECAPPSDPHDRVPDWSLLITRRGRNSFPPDLMSNAILTSSEPRRVGMNATLPTSATSSVPVEPAATETSGLATVAPSLTTSNWSRIESCAIARDAPMQTTEKTASSRLNFIELSSLQFHISTASTGLWSVGPTNSLPNSIARRHL